MKQRLGLSGLLTAALLGLLVFGVGLLPQGAGADDGGDQVDVDTHAYVDNTASPPIINAKWELPDMQPVLSPGSVEYEAVPPTDLNANTIPDADDDPLTPGMQMFPNLEDFPATRLIEYFLAVEDPDGVGDILSTWVDVYHPDGSFKYQIDLEWVPCDYVGLYDDSVTPAILNIHPPLLAAIDTEQVTLVEAEQIIIRCYKNEKAIYHGFGDLSKHQPWGPYEVRGFGQDTGGGVSPPYVNYFDVLPIIGLVTDFPIVDWGKIKPLTTDWVSGDEDLSTPNKPTVKNTGNALMQLGLHFHQMVGDPDPTKTINDFDARFMGEDLQFPASTLLWFSGKLGSNDIKQLDLSIHPPAKLPPQDYWGLLEVHARVDP